MRNSFLFIPGNNPSMLQNIDVYDTKNIIIDLEDSISIEEKDEARILVKTFLSSFRSTKNIYIRVNEYSTEYFLKDLFLLDTEDFNGYILPKASKEALDKMTSITEKTIILLLETPKNIIDTFLLIESKQVIGSMFGAYDYTKELRIKRTVEGKELLYARSVIVNYCSAYNKFSIDTPYADYLDDQSLIKDTTNAKNLGFTHKAAIHPSQLDIINNVFSYTEEEINDAKRIVIKHKQCNKSVFSLDGKMIDEPIIKKAYALLEELGI